ncbi:MAG: hypothetical protein WBH10_00435 [Allopontixanthobacter sediminis]
MDTADIGPANGAATKDEQRRKELREKIGASEARLEERSLGDYAREARDTATGFVREHPIATVGAALALGVVLAAIIPGPGRRLTKRVGYQVSDRATALAAIAAEMGIAYGSSLMGAASSAARTGQDKLEDLGDSLGDSARNVRREASHRAAKASDSAASLKRNVGRKAGRAARDIRARIS